MDFSFKRGLVGLAVCLATNFSFAEDVDLFAGITPPNSGLPNILFVLDSSANWSSGSMSDCYYKNNGVGFKETYVVKEKGEDVVKERDAGPPDTEQGTKMAIEKCALYNVIDALPVNPDGSAKFNVGFMLLNESPYDGAYPRKAFTSLSEANKDSLKGLVRNVSMADDKGNNAAFAKALHEGYLYYKGLPAYNGRFGSEEDDNAFLGENYNSPSSASCARNHIILIANGAPQGKENGDAKSLLEGLGGDVTQLVYPTSEVGKNEQDNWADEYARFLRGADVSSKDDSQGITVHGIAVTGASSDGTFPAFINKIADQGGGSYFSAGDADSLAVAITNIFSQIQAVNSVFASASLPVSVSTQGTYLNRVYIGMFRPDASPRWAGNLKQYKFVAESATEGGYKLFLGDQDSQPAISTAKTGFISACARSFWTPSIADAASPDTYWSFKPQGTCTIPNKPNLDQADSPDGDIVEKGAASYLLRRGAGLTPTTRKVLTCTQADCLGDSSSSPAIPALSEFSTTNSGLSADVVNWVRGADNRLDDSQDKLDVDLGMRATIHGDVVHSRPVAVDYGNDDVVVFYGANDGVLRAINGNQTGNIASKRPGEELWSFVAPEHYSKLDRLRVNSPRVYYPGMVAPADEPAPARKSYFFDGPVTAHKNGDNVWIYAAMRRGGSSVYAFDVSKSKIDSPELMWRLDSTDLPNIGQTWSSPKVLFSEGYTDGATPAVPKPLLIMGGGYDTCEDGTISSDLNTCGGVSDPKGSEIYVLDAATGVVKKTLQTDRSVVGDVTVVSGSDGLATYAYAADTGGNVYRITISGAPDTWTINKIAAFGCDGGVCTTDPAGGNVANRKFLFGPEVVVTSNYNAVLLGSGDREHPLSTDAVTAGVDNAFFMIKDYRASDPAVITISGGNLVQIAPGAESLTTTQQNALGADTNRGWYMQFGTPATDVTVDHDKEQVVTSAVVVFGKVTFSTHMPKLPDINSCGSNLGLSRVYNLSYLDGTGTFQMIAGGGLPPSPVAGIVHVCTAGGDCFDAPFLMGGDPDSPVEVEYKLKPSGAAVNKSRVYWYMEQQ